MRFRKLTIAANPYSTPLSVASMHGTLHGMPRWAILTLPARAGRKRGFEDGKEGKSALLAKPQRGRLFHDNGGQASRASARARRRSRRADLLRCSGEVARAPGDESGPR